MRILAMKGRPDDIPGVAWWGSALLVLGLYAAPIEFNYWFLLLILLELAAIEFKPEAFDEGP